MAPKKNLLVIASAISATLGLVTLASVAYDMIFAESQISHDQIKFAETVPLVSGIPDHEESNSENTKLKIGDVFAKIYIPRFGNSYVHAIAEGTSISKVLNKVGIGHYIHTQMPGEVGNFALAGHRFGNGGPMYNIDKFQNGDKIYVKTADRWFVYKYLQTKVVKPIDIGVIDADPKGLDMKIENGKYLTLTSCTPVHINTHRIIAWFGYESEQPVTSGAPDGLKVN